MQEDRGEESKSIGAGLTKAVAWVKMGEELETGEQEALEGLSAAGLLLVGEGLGGGCQTTPLLRADEVERRGLGGGQVW